MPYKKKADEVLVDPAALTGPPASPYLRPGPPPAESQDPSGPVWEALEGEQVQEEVERLTAEVLPTVIVPGGVEDCTSCGHPNPVSQKFCGECGSRIEKAVKWVCGHANPDASKFCGECGQPAFASPVTGAGVAVELAAQAAALRPKPAAQLSPEERKERERTHAEALRIGSQMPNIQPEPPRTSETIMIHFLEDGLTFAGQVWFRGQGIELDLDSPRYLEQGQYWMHLTDFEQVERYGKVMFRQGPWPGKRYTDVSPDAFQSLAAIGGKDGARVQGPSAEELARAEQMEARRQRGVAPMPRL